MDEIFRASEQDWKAITRRATSECVGILELRDRLIYLENSDRELTGKLQTMQTLSESQRGRLQELSGRLAVLEARAERQQTTPHPDAPSDEELWELRRAAQQGRTSMENWITRAEIHGNRALFDAGVEWATRRAEQQTTTEEPSAAEPAPADPDTPQTLHDVALAHVDSLKFRDYRIPPEILDTIRRAIREPMAAPAGRVATDEEIQAAYDEAYDDAGGYQAGTAAGFRAIYNLARQDGAACPHIRSNGATNWCALAEQQAPAAPAPDPAPPAPAGGLTDPTPTAPNWREPYSGERAPRTNRMLMLIRRGEVPS